WIINESVSYFNEFRPLDCFVATLLATTVPKIVPYRELFIHVIAHNYELRTFCKSVLALRLSRVNKLYKKFWKSTPSFP
ncbi:TPA: hypothetical protein ACF74P_000367, partial [Legionella pneumophila]